MAEVKTEQQEVETKEGQESNAFQSDAFLKEEETKAEDDGDETKDEGTNEGGNAIDDDDEIEFPDFSWDDVEYDEGGNDVSASEEEGAQDGKTKEEEEGKTLNPTNTMKNPSDVNTPEENTGYKDEQEPTWKTLAKDLNIHANSYEELLENINKSQQKIVVTEDQHLQNINRILSMDSESRIREVLKMNPEYTPEDIEDFINHAKENGTLRFEDKNIIADLKKQKDRYLQYLEQQKKEKAKEKEQYRKEFDNKFKDKLKNTEKVLGGKITDKERNEMYTYLTSGKFQDDILTDLDSLVDVLFFKLYKDKILKIFLSKGKSEGKQSLLQNLGMVPRPQSGRQVDVEDTGQFDPNKFIAS